MRVTFYPKRLLLTVAFIVGLTVMLSVATNLRAGLLGIAGLIAYVLFEVFFTVNPTAWWGNRHR